MQNDAERTALLGHRSPPQPANGISKPHHQRDGHAQMASGIVNLSNTILGTGMLSFPLVRRYSPSNFREQVDSSPDVGNGQCRNNTRCNYVLLLGRNRRAGPFLPLQMCSKGTAPTLFILCHLADDVPQGIGILRCCCCD